MGTKIAWHLSWYFARYNGLCEFSRLGCGLIYPYHFFNEDDDPVTAYRDLQQAILHHVWQLCRNLPCCSATLRLVTIYPTAVASDEATDLEGS